MNEVKKPKKPLISYYCIVLLILILFNSLAMPWLMEHQIKDVDYGTFIQMTEDGQVGRVNIKEQSNTIVFTDKEEKTIYQTAMVDDPDPDRPSVSGRCILLWRRDQADFSDHKLSDDMDSATSHIWCNWRAACQTAHEKSRRQKCHELWHG